MSKYADVSADTQELFDKVLSNTNIPDYVSFKLLQSETEKNPMKILKSNPLVEHLTKVEVVIIVNESLLDELGEENTEILYDELIAGVFFDNEKNKLIIEKPDFSSYKSIMKKYGTKINIIVNITPTIVGNTQLLRAPIIVNTIQNAINDNSNQCLMFFFMI